jgi:hypothetical protein
MLLKLTAINVTYLCPSIQSSTVHKDAKDISLSSILISINRPSNVLDAKTKENLGVMEMEMS